MMLFSLIENLDKIDVILASASPRRYELLKTIGLDFRVVVSEVKEDKINADNLIDGVINNARKKGTNIANKYPDALIICADTIVVVGDKILGKPKDEKDARLMLENLSGRTHQVITGFGLIFNKYNKSIFDAVTTDVTFRNLSNEEILAYVNTGEAVDKAGAYAIQGQGSILVEKINGCYFNVVGFPISKFFMCLDKFLKDISGY